MWVKLLKGLTLLSFVALSGCIVGGEAIKYSEAPWQVAVIQKGDLMRLMASSVVGLLWIVSGFLQLPTVFFDERGRRITPNSKFYVGYGSENLLRGLESVSIAKVELGPSYPGAFLQDDIALVKVSPSMRISKFMRLPDASIERERLRSDLVVMVTGWGLQVPD